MNSVERVKAICKERKIPISKIEGDLGFSNGYIGQLRKGSFPADRLAKIAKYLDVSVDYLLSGDETKKAPTLTKKDERDIERRLSAMIEDLNSPVDSLMFDGEPIDDETRQLLEISLRNQLEISKRIAKQRFTPKKYRKEGG